MARFIDLTGKRFNSLMVLRMDPKRIDGNAMWICRCDCGNETKVRTAYLKNDNTKSCGCIKPESTRATLFRGRRDSYGGFNRDDLG